MKKALINGISLNFIEKNTECENTLIFLHGNSHSLRTFSHQMDSDSLKNYRLVFVDLPGHGESSRSETYSVKIFAQILAEFILMLELKNFIIVGHSLGGHIAINILNTKISPSGLFLFGTPPLTNPFDVDAFRPNPQAKAIGMVHADHEEISILMDEMNYVGEEKALAIEDFLKTDPVFRTGVLDDISSGKNENEVELIKSFKVACLFLLATTDSLINNGYIKKYFEGNELTAISEIEAGHSPHIERPLEFNRALVEFSDGIFEPNLGIIRKQNDQQHERSQNEQRN